MGFTINFRFLAGNNGETCVMSEPLQYTAAPVEEPKSGPPASHFFAAKKEASVKVKYQLA